MKTQYENTCAFLLAQQNSGCQGVYFSGGEIAMSLNHDQPGTLSAEWREYIMAPLREAKLRDYAAQLWSDAIDAEDYDKAQRIAAEMDSWFEPEAEQ